MEYHSPSYFLFCGLWLLYFFLDRFSLSRDRTVCTYQKKAISEQVLNRE